MAQKLRKCRICKKEFKQITSLHICCSIECTIENANNNIDKKVAKEKENAAKELREAKEHIKTRSEWMKEAQTAFNAFIRARDRGNPCISCYSFTGKQNAGHFLSVGSTPELRFDELNCYLQCEKCNSYLSGNLINYRKNLLARAGPDVIDYLEGPHEPKKFTILELKEIKALYKQKLKELLKSS